MKKRILSVIALAVGLCTGAGAQTVPNGAFENWTNIAYDEPGSWSTSNFNSLRINQVTVNKVPGVSGSAIRLQTKIVGNDTLGGYFSNSGMGDPSAGMGGIPFNQKPDGITGKYMANMMGNDSAILLVMFKKAGTPLSINFFKLGGKNQNTFSTFTFPISFSGVPDSVIIAAASSNLESNIGVENGSSIVFDDLAFTGTGVTKVIPNGNFDAWTALNKQVLDNWMQFSGVVARDTTRYKGAYAVKLSTVDHGGGEVEAAMISTGHMSPQNFLVGGTPFTNKVDTLCGYYKFASNTGDSGAINCTLIKSGGLVGEFVHYFKAAAGYTYFEIPFNVNTAPDTMRIDIQSVFYPFSMAPTAVLWIDELQLKSAPLKTGLRSILATEVLHTAYPNPAREVLTISTNAGDLATVSVYDMAGKTMITEVVKGSADITLNTSSLTPGVYFYILETGSGEVLRNKFVKN